LIKEPTGTERVCPAESVDVYGHAIDGAGLPSTEHPSEEVWHSAKLGQSLQTPPPVPLFPHPATINPAKAIQ